VKYFLLDEWPRRDVLLEGVQEERHLRDTPFLKGFKKILSVARFFLNKCPPICSWKSVAPLLEGTFLF